MFKSIIDRLTGKPKTDPSDWVQALATALAPIDTLEPKLAARSVAYIQTHEDRPVLNALDAQGPAFELLLRQLDQEHIHKADPNDHMHWQYTPSTVLQNALEKAIKAVSGDPEALARVIEIGARTSWRNTWGIDTLRKSGLPDVVLLFCRWNRDVWSQHFDTVVAAVKLLGGQQHQLLIADYITRYDGIGYSHAQDAPWLSTLSVDNLQACFAQFDAPGREALLGAWRKSGQDPKGDSLDLVISLMQDSSAKVRDQARKLMVQKNDPRTLPEVVALLQTGSAGARTAAVQFLGEIGTPEALAALTAQSASEKSTAIKKLIAQFLDGAQAAATDAPDGGYLAVDRQQIRPPELVVLRDTDSAPFDRADADLLRELAEADMVKKRKELEKYAPDDKRLAKLALLDWKAVLDFANGKAAVSALPNRFGIEPLEPWLAKAIARMPPARALHLTGLRRGGSIDYYIQNERACDWLLEQFDAGAFDLRSLFAWLNDEAVAEVNKNHAPPPHSDNLSESLFRRRITTGSLFYGSYLGDIPDRAVWPWVVEHLAILAEYLPPRCLDTHQNRRALELIACLPALPQSLVAPLLNACTAPQRQVRKAAQALLVDVQGVEAPLIEMLSDSRQNLRASAATYLAQRNATLALPNLLARLKKEKSETARAAMIPAVAALGGDTGPWLGRKALEAEAAANATKLSADKLAWLNRDLAPALQWADGSPTPSTLAEGWLRLALKLKSPTEGAALFGQYLDQMRPQDAQAFGNWVLESWVAHDSYQRPYSEVFAEKLREIRAMPSARRNSPYYRDKTDEELAAEYTRYEQTTYPNSGTDSRGILALAVRAAPARMARTIVAYLKAHGKRVAQAKTLLEVLAAAGSPEAVQVIVATSTRFKQRTVRELAGELVQRIADEREWTADALADRSIPSGGIDESGVLELVTGEEAKAYTARLDSALRLRIFNPEGREVKSLPAGKDENSKEAKALLTAAKAAVTSVSKQQAARLYEAMLSARSWALEDWQNDLNHHPILSRLTEKVVWRGLDGAGAPLVTFRPTPEGDLFDAAGEDADLTGVTRIDLAHGALLGEELAAQWVQHLQDFEVEPLFPQLTRPVLKPDATSASETEILDRTGWLGELLRLRSDCARLGYDKGPTGDSGSFESFDKIFPSAGLVAEICTTGSYQGADNHPVAIRALRFVRLKGRAAYRSRTIPLAEVPPLLLSECWNDLHDISARMAFDPDWAVKAGY